MNGNNIFLIEQDEIDWEWYFSKIPFHSFERDRISQKLNLPHALVPMIGKVPGLTQK
jgi:hypothetical protein